MQALLSDLESNDAHFSHTFNNANSSVAHNNSASAIHCQHVSTAEVQKNDKQTCQAYYYTAGQDGRTQMILTIRVTLISKLVNHSNDLVLTTSSFFSFFSSDITSIH